MAHRLPPLVLAYHGVDAVPLRLDPAGLFVSPIALTRHIAMLRRWGYRFATFGELASRASTGDAHGQVALTFDDGFADNLHTLVPLLRREGVPATTFVVASWDGIPHPDAPFARALTHDEVRQLATAGVEIGSHSMAHRDLSALDYATTLEDLSQSRTVLEAILDRTVDLFAYPFGRVGPETAQACRAAGFRAACRTQDEGSWDDPWNLPRQDVHNATTRFDLWLKHRGWYEPLMARVVGRAVRSAIRRTKARIQ